MTKGLIGGTKVPCIRRRSGRTGDPIRGRQVYIDCTVEQDKILFH